MSELMCSQAKCRRKDEHIAELEAENAELREVYRCAKGLCTGEDWNGGTAALYYRKPLREAVEKAALHEKGGMSDCRCEFQGRPVTGHFSYCPVWKDERIAELKTELEKYVLKESGWVAYDIRVQSELQSKDQELAELREGIKEHSQCFNADEGDPHDVALWALLQEKGE